MMPRPPAPAIDLTEKQEELLNRVCRRQTSPQQQVRRAQIILRAAEGQSDKQISELLNIHRITARSWRKRWSEAADEMLEVEKRATDKELLTAIERVLADAYRSGTPPTFSAEQVVQIIALACEAPAGSQRPVSHWTPREIADEAVKRGLVESISPQSVERFLKGSGAQAASVSLLADL